MMPLMPLIYASCKTRYSPEYIEFILQKKIQPREDVYTWLNGEAH